MINRKIVIIAIIFMFVSSVLLLIAASNSNTQSIDSLPEDGLALDIDIKTQANIVDDEGILFEGLESVAVLKRLSEDLHVFAKTTYKPYENNETELIGFRVNISNRENNTVTAEGKFGASNNTILIAVEILNNDRIKTSITDKSTDRNIDDALPSNNKRDIFIGSMPLTESGFVIDYVEMDDFFSVNILGESSLQEKALSIIKIGLGEEFFDIDNIFIYGGGEAVVNNNF